MSLLSLPATLILLSQPTGDRAVQDGAAPQLSLGVVLPGSAVDPSVAQGALLAASDLTARGPVRCAVLARAAASNWDSLGNVARTLIVDDGVAALLVPPDGAATHLLQQIGTKTRTAVLTLATEDALTRLYVGNTLRCVPDDRAQVRALLTAPAAAPGGPMVAVVAAGRDGEASLAAMRRVAAELGVAPPAAVPVETDTPLPRVVDAVLAARPATVLVWLAPRPAGELVRALRPRTGARVLGWHQLLADEFLAAAGVAAEGTTIVALFDPDSDDAHVRAFVAAYQARHGTRPDATAALAYDAASLVLSLARENRAGDRESVLLALPSTRSLSQVTRHMQFDASGNWSGAIPIGVCRQGRFRVLPCAGP